MSHSHAGAVCAHATKKACDLARKLELGQCQEMVEAKGEPYPCTHWAVDRVDARGYCGVHITSVIRAADERLRAERKRAEVDGRIAAYLTFRETHPSVWDSMPKVVPLAG